MLIANITVGDAAKHQTSIVNQAVETAEVLGNQFDDFFDCFGIRDVPLH